jgi:hypothetical protein
MLLFGMLFGMVGCFKSTDRIDTDPSANSRVVQSSSLDLTLHNSCLNLPKPAVPQDALTSAASTH